MEDLVKVYEYQLDEEFIEKCIEEERELTNKDVEIELHKILEDNGISYKNKIVQDLDIELKYYKISANVLECNDYCFFVEVYVDKVNQEEAEKLINIYMNGGETNESSNNIWTTTCR